MRRRTVLVSAGGALVGGLAGCLSAPPGGSSDQNDGPAMDDTVPSGTWPQIGYDAQHTSHTPDARGPRDDATVVWTSFGDRAVFPPVVDDALYLTEAMTDGTAYSLDTEDGTERWSNADLPPMRWPPTLHEDRLLVLTREEGNVVRLHALDTSTGEQTWVREEGITATSGSRPPIAPTVRGGSVYLASNRGIVTCDAATGEIEWTAELGPHLVRTENGPTWRTDWAKPAVTAERAFTFDTNDGYQETREIYAVDRSSGELDWTAELDLGNRWYLKGHVVAGAEYVYVPALKSVGSGSGGNSEWKGTERLFALERDSGAVAWDWELSRKTLSPPAYADGTLYVGEWYPYANTGRLHALDASDGNVTWTYRIEKGAVLWPTVADDTVYIGQGKEFTAIATADGTRRWRLEIGERVGPPTVVGETAYVQTNPGYGNESRVLAVREPSS